MKTDNDGLGSRPRREVPPIKVWVTDAEKAEIVGRAAQGGLSLSAYMLTAGLNHPVRSVYDLRAVAELGRVNGDLGRVAGLLKLWLAEGRGQDARHAEVKRVMSDFRRLQSELHVLMCAALK
ncbi:CopG family transcriptional regulator [Stenotrophomonas sp. PS02297]|uniref:plasmid mobilization protein n=1 Tax=Stenotrophomonas sp. PS02297 TaxID=2991423 RepID=UPI002499DB04|nr:CopG family transcriptional regulator [Stenotrophomonas sp. PS02297]